MGLLDEAIREHLELKRRRGADPTEIAVAERDALGPARRGPEPLEVPQDAPARAAVAEPEDVEAEPVVEPEPVAVEPQPREDPEPETTIAPAVGGAVAASALEAERERGESEPEPEPEIRSAGFEPDPDPEPATRLMSMPAEPPASDEPGDDLAWESRQDEWDEPAPRSPEAPSETGEETVAFDSLAHGGEADRGAEAPAEDVLEETPEFLQETPEHDRLWFEQRPPRDFDFDK